MKKLVAILFVIALLASLSVTAFAASGINQYEQEVLDKLSTSAVIGKNGWSFSIPQAYINSAKNYFASEGDMTEAEKNAIIGYINAGMEVIKNDGDAKDFHGKEYHLADMSQESREAVLKYGQSACAEVDLSLVYVPASNKVVITPVNSSTPVFESAPVIKVTGEEFAPNAGTVMLAVIAMIVLGSAVMLVVSKKKGLLV